MHQRGGVIIWILFLSLLIAGAWYVTKYAIKHPVTTEQAVPTQTIEQGQNAVNRAKHAQSQYPNPTNQY